MRFSSTPESAAEGEITLLAIVETLVAISVSVLLVKLLDSSAHIVVGALIAPFLLLRSETSTTRAYSIFDLCFQRLTKLGSFGQRCHEGLPAVLRAFAFLFVWLPLFSFVLITIKSIATVATLISSPRETLLAIPRNWLRIALATDHRHPPELLPGTETATEEAPPAVRSFRYEEVRRHLTSGTGGALFQRLALLAIYAPAVIYRLLLKSTSLIYFPLIWVSNVPMTVKGVLSFPLERVRRWYALAVLLIMLSPLVISFHIQDTLATPQDRVVFTYVLPVGKIDLWHISRVVAVAVTMALYFYARSLDDNNLRHPERVRWIITSANRLRAACGVFTMGCFLLIVLTL